VEKLNEVVVPNTSEEAGGRLDASILIADSSSREIDLADDMRSRARL